MRDIKLSLNAAIAITGAVLIAAYIIFGGSFPSKKNTKRNIRKKGTIPGLANVGNTCFLNCILQALASCPSFIKWLESSIINTRPILLCTLETIVKVLNNKTEESVASAYDVLKALRSHGWVISAEEQDAHELFHALTSTIDEELLLVRQEANSLLNVSWMGLEKDGSLEVSGNRLEKDGSLGVSGNGLERDQDKREAYKEMEHPEESFDPPFKLVGSAPPGEGVRARGAFGRGKVSLFRSPKASIITKVPSSLSHPSPFGRQSTYLESPFKGHLASQLQCEVCGFRNAEQWSAFESLSLSLPPSSTWALQKTSLQELLDAFVRPECVSDVTCEGCTKRSGGPRAQTASFSKQLTIGKLPECLCIHIQRTIWLENGCAVKRKDFVSFPELLSMDPYTYTVSINQKQNLKGGLLGGREPLSQRLGAVGLLSGQERRADSLEALGDSLEALLADKITGIGSLRFGWKDHSLYRLQAVVVHVGDVFSGHFVTYRRGALHTTLRERWFYTSDVVVKEVALDEVLQSNAYMIIYERLHL